MTVEFCVSDRPLEQTIDRIVYEVPWSLEWMPLLEDLSRLRESALAKGTPKDEQLVALYMILHKHMPKPYDAEWQCKVDAIAYGTDCKCEVCQRPPRPWIHATSVIALCLAGVGMFDPAHVIWPLLALGVLTAGIYFDYYQ